MRNFGDLLHLLAPQVFPSTIMLQLISLHNVQDELWCVTASTESSFFTSSTSKQTVMTIDGKYMVSFVQICNDG